MKNLMDIRKVAGNQLSVTLFQIKLLFLLHLLHSYDKFT
jgi:hypothetical protein